MIFEIDHYYAHADGRLIHIIGELPSTRHGWCLVAEQHDRPGFIPVGRGSEARTGWSEVSQAEWLTACAAPVEAAAESSVEKPSNPAPAPRAHGGYVAAEAVEFLHPADHPPEHGAKMLLYMFPWGVTVVGQWQGSGAALWAPLPKVSSEMHDRLDRELAERRLASVLAGGSGRSGYK